MCTSLRNVTIQTKRIQLHLKKTEGRTLLSERKDFQPFLSFLSQERKAFPWLVMWYNLVENKKETFSLIKNKTATFLYKICSLNQSKPSST